MKRFFVFFLSAASHLCIYAQSLPDSSLFAKGMQMIEEATSVSQYVSAASYFRSVAEQKEGLWLARYYAGLSYALASQEQDTEKTKDALIDQAQTQVDKAMEMAPENPEVVILQAFVYQSRIQVNPLSRGLTYSMKANAMLQKAMEESPDNPRAQLLLAYNTYYTPAIVGGGAANALPMFIRARDLFDAFNPASPFTPRWGRKEAVSMIEACRNEIKP